MGCNLPRGGIAANSNSNAGTVIQLPPSVGDVSGQQYTATMWRIEDRDEFRDQNGNLVLFNGQLIIPAYLRARLAPHEFVVFKTASEVTFATGVVTIVATSRRWGCPSSAALRDRQSGRIRTPSCMHTPTRQP